MTYRKIDTKTWSDSKFLELSPEGKLTFIYLITAPQGDMSGCVECSAACLARDTGLTREQAASALDEIESAGLVKSDQDTNEVLVRRFGSHQWSKSPTAQTATRKAIEGIVSSSLREDALRSFSAFLGIQYPYPMDTVPTEYQYSTDRVSSDENGEKTPGKIEYPYSIDTVSGSGTGTGSGINPIPESKKLPNPQQPERARAQREPRPIPTLKEVQSYCRRNGILVDSKAFFDLYERQGWKDSSGEIVWDWQKMLERWAKTQREKVRENRRWKPSEGPVYDRSPRCPHCGNALYEDSKGDWLCFNCNAVMSSKGKEVRAS